MQIDLEINTPISKESHVEIIRNKMNTKTTLGEKTNVEKKEIEISKLIDNPFQPRLSYDDESILELALSIKAEGLLQPIGVMQDENDKYVIVYGHRRVRAFRKLKLEKIPVVVEEKNHAKLRSRALIENIQREDMHHIDIALSMKQSLDNQEYKSQNDLASAIGKEKTYISKMLGLLTLPDEVIEDLVKNKSINDRFVLDLMRRIKNPDSCKKIYFWYIQANPTPTRADLAKKIESLDESLELEEKNELVDIKSTAKGCVIKLPKLDNKSMEEVKAMLEKYLRF